MKVSELFTRLSYGELSNLAISGEGSGQIIQEKQPQILGYLNESLLALYSRFNLLEKSVIIEQTGTLVMYPLSKKYAESNTSSDAPHKFIKDLLYDTFENDVIRILEVYDYMGWKYTLNDPEDAASFFTPTPSTLQVPFPRNGVALDVSYQARHKVIPMEDYEDVEIELPFYLETALQNLIASKVYSHMNGADNLVKSQEYAGTYEKTCIEVEAKDLVNQTVSQTNTKFRKRGFV